VSRVLLLLVLELLLVRLRRLRRLLLAILHRLSAPSFAPRVLRASGG
jgi:hypothetical protein